MFCDVTSVLETPTACGLSLQNLLGAKAGMLSTLINLFRRANQIPAESRPRQKEARLVSSWRRMKKWTWGRPSESWAGVGELPGGGGLELVFPGG